MREDTLNNNQGGTVTWTDYDRHTSWKPYLFGLIPISPWMAGPMPRKNNSGVRRWLQPFVTLKRRKA